jgi:hypothetical protein
LRFGLVSFEVQAINAQIKEQSEIHFHLVHEPDHQRIHYAKTCPKHGEVPNDEIVAYEYAKGKYVEFQKKELDVLRTEKERALNIDAFIIEGDFWQGTQTAAHAIRNYCRRGEAIAAAAIDRTVRHQDGLCASQLLRDDRDLTGLLQDGVFHLVKTG